MPVMVHRTYACGVCGFSTRIMVVKGSPLLNFECPDCAKAIAEGEEAQRLAELSPYGDDAARSDNIGAPLPMSPRMKAVKRFEKNFTRPHFPDGSPIFTDLKDSNREGDIAAVSDPSLMKQMAAMGGGWGGAGAATSDASGQPLLNRVGGSADFMGRKVVDLQGARLPKQ